MGARILVLGAGFGGIAAATELRRGLGPEHEVTLVDRSDSFMMGLRKLWIMVGHSGPDEGRRSLEPLRGQGIRLIRDTVQAIDTIGRNVRLGESSLDYDYLVVALGADLRPDLVEGLAQHSHDFYDAASIPALAAALARFQGGRLLILVAGSPYKCPPAPYEAAMLLEHHLRERQIRTQTELSVAVPMPMAVPAAGKAASAALSEALSSRGITLHTGHKVQRVERDRVFFESAELGFDLLLSVPPHRCPQVAVDAGLTEGGPWVKVDPHTLRTSQPGVWAVGDVVQIPLANGLPLPKAGLLAEMQGRVAAAQIAAEINGGPKRDAFDGKGYCWVEMGGGVAGRMESDFYAQPEPGGNLTAVGSDQFEAKRRFEQERLTRWFGG